VNAITRYCGICRKAGESGRQVVEHHRSYHPEVIVMVCKSCHKLIHRLAKYPDRQLMRMIKEAVAYRPNAEDAEGFVYWRYGDQLRKEGRKRQRPPRVAVPEVVSALEPELRS